MVNNCLEDGQLILEWAVKVCALTLKRVYFRWIIVYKNETTENKLYNF